MPSQFTEGATELSPRDWDQALFATVGDYGSLGARAWAEVREIQVFPNIKVGDSVWVVPENWLPPGTLRRASSRTLTARCRSDNREPSEAASLCDQSLRRSLLALALPRRTRTGIRRLKPSTWLSRARYLLRMGQWVASHQPSPDGRLWSHLQAEDWKAMLSAATKGSRYRKEIRIVADCLAEFGERGVLVDFPARIEEAAPKRNADSPSLEKSHRGKSAPSRPEQKEGKTTEPFSDAFVTEMIGRAIWLQDNLGSQLIECWAQLRTHASRSASIGRSTSHPKTIEERRAIISSFPWHDATGKPLTRLPWTMTWARERTTTNAWPPRDAISINIMVGVLQALNYCTHHFCTGGRSSEGLDATDDSVDPYGTGHYRARTSKTEDSEGGVERDWPLHPRGQNALQLQQQLARVIRPDGEVHLWILLQDGAEPAGSPLRNVNEPVVQAVSQLGLTHLTGKSRPHSHRWRHTVARLIALCVAAAPQVLMDLFGHRDFEMTLRYMLSDPRVAEDVQRVAKEIAFATAEEALADIESGSAGGPAATSLGEGITSFKMRRGESELGADSISEAIEILTFNGRLWQLVRPGVLCTKGLGQFGPCTQGRGSPDAGGCRTGCDHRLEMARAKAHCVGALSALLDEHTTASDQGLDMILANLEGQILAHLMRWDDVRQRVLANSETARTIWSTRLAA